MKSLNKISLSILFFLSCSSMAFGQDIKTNQTSTDKLQGSIMVSEELSTSLPLLSSSITLEIKSSGKLISEAALNIENIKRKLSSISKNNPPLLTDRTISSDANRNLPLTSTSQVFLKETLVIPNIPENTLISVVESLLKVSDLQILRIEPEDTLLTEKKKNFSTQVTQAAYQKALHIAQQQGLKLGEILEIAVTEEPTAESIRSQLESNSLIRTNSNIKFVASLRIALVK